MIADPPQPAGRRRAPGRGPERDASTVVTGVHRAPGFQAVLAMARLRGMIGELLVEQRRAPLDQPARRRMQTIYLRSVEEARRRLPAREAEEFGRLGWAFGPGDTPSDVELRLATGQLIGWIEGCFAGADFESSITEAAVPAVDG